MDRGNILLFGGIGLMAGGAGWVYPPASLLVAGVFLFALGLIVELSGHGVSK